MSGVNPTYATIADDIASLRMSIERQQHHGNVASERTAANALVDLEVLDMALQGDDARAAFAATSRITTHDAVRALVMDALNGPLKYGPTRHDRAA